MKTQNELNVLKKLKQKEKQLDHLLDEIITLKNDEHLHTIEKIKNRKEELQTKIKLQQCCINDLLKAGKRYNPLSFEQLRKMSHDKDIHVVYNRLTSQFFVLKNTEITYSGSFMVFGINGEVFNYDENTFYCIEQKLPNYLFL
jgi:uncharacterized protein YerC